MEVTNFTTDAGIYYVMTNVSAVNKKNNIGHALDVLTFRRTNFILKARTKEVNGSYINHCNTNTELTVYCLNDICPPSK